MTYLSCISKKTSNLEVYVIANEVQLVPTCRKVKPVCCRQAISIEYQKIACPTLMFFNSGRRASSYRPRNDDPYHVFLQALFMNHLLLLTAFLLFPIIVTSQGIKGVVTDDNNISIPYTTIYLKQTHTGTTTNEQGEYEIKLNPGIYKVVFQALGYERKEFEIVVKDSFAEQNVFLKKHVVKLKEVKVYSGGEDPAYPIMRKAISLAPYYLRQTGHYESEVYIKGTLIMKKIPRLIANKMEVNGEKIKTGETYTIESLNEIVFNSPDAYDHKVLSYHSTFPGTDDGSPMGYVTNSFYSPTHDMTISPLAPNAFSHYKFRYLGYIEYGDLSVNIIEVIPRRKSQQLFKGKIYIVDNLWNIHSVDLVNEAFFGTYHIKQIYAPVEERIWLPVNHFINIDASVFGIKAGFRYAGAVKYKNIKLNNDLPVPESLIRQYSMEEEAKDSLVDTLKTVSLTNKQKKMEQLLAKEELSNREMIKLARLIEKESRVKEDGESLEVKSNYKFSIKKDTVKRDSVYWNAMRPIPLTKHELRSFEVKDSILLAVKAEESDTITKKKKSAFSKFMNGFLWGESFYACDSAMRLRYDGLLGLKMIDFNAVDGWSYMQSGSLRYRLDSVRSLSFSPSVRYAFNREKLYWGVNSGFSYAAKIRGRLSLSFGQAARDFNRYSGVNSTLNMASALLFKEHYMKLYGDDHFSVSNGMNLIHGMRLNIKASYHSYTRLENTTNFSFFRNDDNYASNTPQNDRISDMNLNDQRGFIIESSLSYTPRQKYRMYKGRKIMLDSKYPTFTLFYKRGIKSVFNSISDYEIISASVKQEKEWGVFSSFKWTVNGGFFTKNNQTHFSEFRHFNTSEIPVVFKAWDDCFALLEDYKYSTDEKFLEGHIRYATPYLLLKYLPFFSNRLWLENLYGHYLTQPLFKNYAEIGYGISQIFFMGSVGVFVGFEDGNYSRWGFRLAFNIE